MLSASVLTESDLSTLFHVNQGFESTIFQSAYEDYVKIFRFYTDQKRMAKKKEILLKLESAEIYDIIPKISTIYYGVTDHFIGYSMEYVEGKRIDLVCSNLTMNRKLAIFKDFQEKILKLNQKGLFVTDFNPSNFLVDSTDSVKFIDADSFCLENSSKRNMFFISQFMCKYTRLINSYTNLYSLYLVFLESAFETSLIGKSRSKIRKEIYKNPEIPDAIKQNLLHYTKANSFKSISKLPLIF